MQRYKKFNAGRNLDEAKPNLATIRVFGCKATVHITKGNRQKLDAKATECSFVGYSNQSKVFKIYNPQTRKLICEQCCDVLRTPRNK